MQSSLKKSLYLGLAALSFASVAAVSTTASAKSYAKAGAYTTLTTDATKRNVEATGSNALYTKPGTVKGAKVVASKKVMTTLATSKKSANYFRAYGQKVTNRGSVYYRVVTMDGKYRGYIYGGKTEGTFAGGIKAAETTTKAALPTNKTVYFTNPGTTNVTWTAPKYTQYKASKNVLNTTPFAGDTLTITDAVTKTREGSLYYYVKDAQHPSVSGWIYSKAVTSDASVAYNQATDVKVNFVATDGTIVKSTTLAKLHANDNKTNTVSTDLANAKGTAVGFDVQKQATNAWGANLLKGTGYDYSADLAANQSALLAAKTGDVVSLNVTKGTQAVQSISAYTQKGTGNPVQLKKAVTDTTPANADLATTVTFPTLSAAFAGANGANYSANDVYNFLTTNKATKLVSVDYAKTAGTPASGDTAAVAPTNVATTDPTAVNAKGQTKTQFEADATNAGKTFEVQVYHTTYTLTSGVAGTYTTDGTASAFYNTVNEVKGSGVATDNSGSNSVFA